MKTNEKSNKKFVPEKIKVSNAIGGAATAILVLLFGEYVLRIALPLWDAVCEVAEQYFPVVFNMDHVMSICAVVMMVTAFVVLANRLWIKEATKPNEPEGAFEASEHSGVATLAINRGATPKRGGAFLKKDVV